MDPVFEKDGVKVYTDTDAQDPRKEFDHIGTMVCFHKRYQLGDEGHGYRHAHYTGWDDMEADIVRMEKPVAILPVYLYDHSGLTVNTTGFSCPWDSGQIGFIFARRAAVLESFRTTRITKAAKEHVLDMLRAEVDLYDQYLRGAVYGYEYNGESCWGFYDYDPESLADAVLAGKM